MNATAPAARTPDALVWPSSTDRNKPRHRKAALNALRPMGFAGRVTAHGLRSVFSSVANAARTEDGGRRWDRDWIEAALAHADGNRIRASYNRTPDNYLEERRELMEWWSQWLRAQYSHPSMIKLDWISTEYPPDLLSA